MTYFYFIIIITIIENGNLEANIFIDTSYILFSVLVKCKQFYIQTFAFFV